MSPRAYRPPPATPTPLDPTAADPLAGVDPALIAEARRAAAELVSIPRSDNSGPSGNWTHPDWWHVRIVECPELIAVTAAVEHQLYDEEHGLAPGTSAAAQARSLALRGNRAQRRARR